MFKYTVYFFYLMVLPTTIKISFKVRNLLKKLKKNDQSYNDYIFQLIQEVC